MPTLLSLMGMKEDIPLEVEGRDYSDSLLGKQDAARPAGALMMGTGATAAWEDGHEWRAFRTERYTYATYLCDNKELFFDNIQDPLQMNDLSKDPKYFDDMEMVKALMKEEMERVNDKFHPSSYYQKNWVENRIILKTKAD